MVRVKNWGWLTMCGRSLMHGDDLKLSPAFAKPNRVTRKSFLRPSSASAPPAVSVFLPNFLLVTHSQRFNCGSFKFQGWFGEKNEWKKLKEVKMSLVWVIRPLWSGKKNHFHFCEGIQQFESRCNFDVGLMDSAWVERSICYTSKRNHFGWKNRVALTAIIF